MNDRDGVICNCRLPEDVAKNEEEETKDSEEKNKKSEDKKKDKKKDG